MTRNCRIGLHAICKWWRSSGASSALKCNCTCHDEA